MSHLTPVPNDPEQLRAWLEARGPSGRGAFVQLHHGPVPLPEAPLDTRALTVTVTLDDTRPPVWRRIVLAGDTTLDRFHDVLQATMGWTDSHLHRFYAGAAAQDPYFVSGLDLAQGEEGTPEKDARLDQLLVEVGDRIRYDYDFGDGWEHEIRLEQLDPLPEGLQPRCTAGAQACPPEDVGGPDGYADVAGWVRAGRPAHAVPDQFESAAHARRWLPRGWHPDAFEVPGSDRQLATATATADPDLLEAMRPPLAEVLGRLPEPQLSRVASWLTLARGRTLTAADLDDVTGPHRRLLAAIGSGAPLSTAGYLPPGLVGVLCPLLDIDPVLAGKANRESNVRPLVMFRKAVQQAGLLHTSGGYLTPTVKGIRYGADPAGLWRHLVDRLPLGRTELRRDVGWFTLAALAGGVDHRAVFDAVHELCVAAGWQEESGAPMARRNVNPLVWPVLCVLVGPRWNSLRGWPAWAPAAAAAVLFADPPR